MPPPSEASATATAVADRTKHGYPFVDRSPLSACQFRQLHHQAIRHHPRVFAIEHAADDAVVGRRDAFAHLVRLEEHRVDPSIAKQRRLLTEIAPSHLLAADGAAEFSR